MTNAEARFSNSLRPRKPEGSLGRTALDGHLDSHTALELCVSSDVAEHCFCSDDAGALFILLPYSEAVAGKLNYRTLSLCPGTCRQHRRSQSKQGTSNTTCSCGGWDELPPADQCLLPIFFIFFFYVLRVTVYRVLAQWYRSALGGLFAYYFVSS